MRVYCCDPINIRNSSPHSPLAFKVEIGHEKRRNGKENEAVYYEIATKYNTHYTTKCTVQMWCARASVLYNWEKKGKPRQSQQCFPFNHVPFATETLPRPWTWWSWMTAGTCLCVCVRVRVFCILYIRADNSKALHSNTELFISWYWMENWHLYISRWRWMLSLWICVFARSDTTATQ